MQVSYQKDAVGAEHVSRVYREKLAARGMRFGGAPSGSMAYEFVGNRLYLTVELKKGPSVDGRGFPSPELVEALYRGLLKDLGERLTTRGKHFEVNKELGISNLIPASVAFLLRASGGIQGRKEIHRLLNSHVYGKERFFGSGGSGTSEVAQLWRDVPKSGIRIARSMPLFWGRPFPEHFAG